MNNTKWDEIRLGLLILSHFQVEDNYFKPCSYDDIFHLKPFKITHYVFYINGSLSYGGNIYLSLITA
jgi:hypothetical protein